MKVYIGAFIGAVFLMLFIGILTEGLVWLVFDYFHATKKVLLTAEIILLLPLLVMFGFVFRQTLEVERDIAAQGF